MKTTARGAHAALIATLLWAAPSAAQVNVERLRKRLEGDGVAASLEASFVGRTGNTESTAAAGSGSVRGQLGPHTGMLALRGEFTRTDHEINVENGFVHLRYNLQLTDAVWGEAFGQMQGDAIRRLRFRALAGLGPRFGLYQSKPFDVYLGVAYMLEREELNDEPGADDQLVTVAHRTSNYLSILLDIGKQFSLSGVVYFQPRMDRPSDFRILGEGNLAVAITDLISVKLELTVRHDSDPPSDVRPTDTTLRNVLAFTF